MKKLAFATVTALLASAPLAHAAISLPNTCGAAPNDISSAVASQTCVGYFEGNVLSNTDSAVAIQVAALDSLGFNTTGFNFNSFAKIELGGSQTVDFAPTLSGITFIGVHYGNGRTGPVADLGLRGGGTAFYKVDFGDASIDTFQLAFGATSGAVLYSTSISPIPEPAEWAMMMAGLGAVGMIARRRRQGLAAN